MEIRHVQGWLTFVTSERNTMHAQAEQCREKYTLRECEMTKKINLTQAVKGVSYRVSGFTDQNSDYCDKLTKMGFTSGTTIELAPVAITDPMVFQIRGSRIALRRKEAADILVEGL